MVIGLAILSVIAADALVVAAFGVATRQQTPQPPDHSTVTVFRDRRVRPRPYDWQRDGNDVA